MIIYSKKRNKRFGYAFSAKRKDKSKLLDEIKKECKKENLELLHIEM